MAAILNFAILDSDILTQSNSTWLKLVNFWLNLMMAAIFNSAMLYSDILPKITFTC